MKYLWVVPIISFVAVVVWGVTVVYLPARDKAQRERGRADAMIAANDKAESELKAKVDNNVAAVKAWNDEQTKKACKSPDGMNVVCDASANANPMPGFPPPLGYAWVFYTSGCPTCAVGWVLKKGSCTEIGALNCAS